MRAFSLSQELKDISIGLLLGDLYVEKQKVSKNARLQFKQSTAHKPLGVSGHRPANPFKIFWTKDPLLVGTIGTNKQSSGPIPPP